MQFPKKKWALVPAEEQAYPKYDGPESLLQGQLDDYLAARGIEFRRIPNAVWAWLKRHSPVWIVKALADTWRSKPDTLVLLPLTDKYSLAVEIELKSKKGKLAPKQAKYAERMPVQVSRSPEQSMAIVEAAERYVDELKQTASGAASTSRHTGFCGDVRDIDGYFVSGANPPQ